MWIFNGARSRFPSGVFSSEEKARKWIAVYRLSGILTEYPIDTSVYEWALENGFFSPKKEKEKSAEFIQQFTCAQQNHCHFEEGEVD